MKALFNTYPVAFDCPGGGEVQLMQTKTSLEDMGIESYFFNQWKPQFKEVNLVHYFSVQGGSMNFCGYVKKIGLPLVISPILWSRSGKYDIKEIKKLMDIADILLPNSAIEAQVLSEDFNIPADKFHIAYNGVNDSFFEDNNISTELFRDRFQVKKPFFLNVANVENRKNQKALAIAFMKLKTDHELIIVGNSRDDSYLKQVLDLGQGRIRYVGYIDHHSDVLKSAYKACEAFVLPSLLETPGLAALEAAAQGCKVLITSEGSTREYFGENCVYCDPLSVDSISEGLESLLGIPRNIALKETVKKFSWRNTALQTLEAYRKIC